MGETVYKITGFSPSACPSAVALRFYLILRNVCTVIVAKSVRTSSFRVRFGGFLLDVVRYRNLLS